MTTIAYRDGVLAADTAMARGGTLYPGSITKIVRASNGCLAGAAGTAGYNGAFLRWALAGMEGDPPTAKQDDRDCDTGIIFRPDGSVVLYEPTGWFETHPGVYAIGSGREFALGAMRAGADAEQAVMAAAAHDPYTGVPVTVLRHD